jgi:hypothetical protein
MNLLRFPRSTPALISCVPPRPVLDPVRCQGAGQAKRHGGPHGSCGAHSAAQRDFRWYWTGVTGWVRVAPQGCPGVQASGRAVGKGWGDFTLRA